MANVSTCICRRASRMWSTCCYFCLSQHASIPIGYIECTEGLGVNYNDPLQLCNVDICIPGMIHIQHVPSCLQLTKSVSVILGGNAFVLAILWDIHVKMAVELIN